MIKRIIVILLAVFCFGCAGNCATEKVFLSEEEVLTEAQFADEPEDVQKARYEAFKDVVYQIDPKTFEKYLKDKNFVAPPKEKDGKPRFKLRFRLINYYSKDIYSLMSFRNLNIYFYSSKTGKLIFIKIYDTKTDAFNMYDTQGRLKYIEYLTFENPSGTIFNGYLFDKNKQWVGIWKKSVLYTPDEKKEIIKFIDDKIFQKKKE